MIIKGNMKYDDFYKKAKEFPVFGDDLLSLVPGGKEYRRLVLSRWASHGKIIRTTSKLSIASKSISPMSRMSRLNTMAQYSSLTMDLSASLLTPI